MNKKLLLFCATLLMAVGAYAQWTCPVPTGTEFKVSETDTTYFFLYNKDAKAFYSDGNSWGTQASFNIPGIKVFFTKYLDSEGVWDGAAYLINDSSRVHGWRLAFFGSETEMWVDWASQANYMFSFEKQANGDYRIYGADANPELSKLNYEDSYIGYDSYDGSSYTDPIRPFLCINDVEEGHQYCVDWTLLTPEEYHSFLPKLQAYNASITLKAAIDDASANHSNINLSQIQAVYDDTSSSVELMDSVKSLLAAAVALSEKIDEVKANYPSVDCSEGIAVLAKANYTAAEIETVSAAIEKEAHLAEVYACLEGASEDNPKNATSLIKNAAFDEGVQWQQPPYWTVEPMGTNNCFQNMNVYKSKDGTVVIDQFMESWIVEGQYLRDGGMYQIMESLPAGKYVMGVDVATYQGGDLSVTLHGVELYAKGGDIVTAVPCNTAQLEPTHFELTFYSTGGDMELGLRTRSTNANWMAADNFTLTYYGETEEDPYRAALNAVIEKYEENYPDVENMVAAQTAKDKVLAEVEKAKVITDGYEAEMDSLAAAYTALDASVAEYVSFKASIDACDAQAVKFETSYPGLSGELSDLSMNWNDEYSEGTATSAEIASVDSVVRKTIVDYIYANITPGCDLTALLVNPDFETNVDGWSYTGYGPVFGGTCTTQLQNTLDETVLTNGNAERYGANFDIYQILYNLPKGSYTVTCQAFERDDSPAGQYAVNFAQGKDYNIDCVLYGNDFSSKINNILAFAQENQVYAAGQWYDDTSTDYGWIPNGMTGANYYFKISPETYQVKCNITLANDGDSLRLGIKTDNSASTWVIFDNFTLTYNGEGVDSYKNQIDELIAKLNSAFDNATSYGSDAQDKTTEAIAQLKTAENGVSGDDCIAAIANGQTALEYANLSISLYESLDDVYTDLSDAIDMYQDISNSEVLSAASDVLDDIQSAQENSDKTNEEVQAIIDKANYYMAAVKVPDTDAATSDNPVDVTSVIVNPTFDNITYEGWGGSGFGSGGTVAANAERYNMAFDTYQDLAGLPAGYYVVKVQGFYRRGTAPNDYAYYTSENPDSCSYASFYATSSVDKASTPLCALSSAAVAESYGGATLTVGTTAEPLYVPNTMEAASYWYAATDEEGKPLNLYMNEIVVKVAEDGNLRIGVQKSEVLTQDWTNVDNFQLLYYGTEAPTAIKNVETAATTSTVKGIYNLAGQKLNSLQKGINIVNGKKYFVK